MTRLARLVFTISVTNQLRVQSGMSIPVPLAILDPTLLAFPASLMSKEHDALKEVGAAKIVPPQEPVPPSSVECVNSGADKHVGRNLSSDIDASPPGVHAVASPAPADSADAAPSGSPPFGTAVAVTQTARMQALACTKQATALGSRILQMFPNVTKLLPSRSSPAAVYTVGDDVLPRAESEPILHEEVAVFPRDNDHKESSTPMSSAQRDIDLPPCADVEDDAMTGDEAGLAVDMKETVMDIDDDNGVLDVPEDPGKTFLCGGLMETENGTASFATPTKHILPRIGIRKNPNARAGSDNAASADTASQFAAPFLVDLRSLEEYVRCPRDPPSPATLRSAFDQKKAAVDKILRVLLLETKAAATRVDGPDGIRTWRHRQEWFDKGTTKVPSDILSLARHKMIWDQFLSEEVAEDSLPIALVDFVASLRQAAESLREDSPVEAPSEDMGSVSSLLHSIPPSCWHFLIMQRTDPDDDQTRDQWMMSLHKMFSHLFIALPGKERMKWIDLSTHLFARVHVTPSYLSQVRDEAQRTYSKALRQQRFYRVAQGLDQGAGDLPLTRGTLPSSSLGPATYASPMPLYLAAQGCFPSPRILQFGRFAGVDQWILGFKVRNALKHGSYEKRPGHLAGSTSASFQSGDSEAKPLSDEKLHAERAVLSTLAERPSLKGAKRGRKKKVIVQPPVDVSLEPATEVVCEDHGDDTRSGQRLAGKLQQASPVVAEKAYALKAEEEVHDVPERSDTPATPSLRGGDQKPLPVRAPGSGDETPAGTSLPGTMSQSLLVSASTRLPQPSAVVGNTTHVPAFLTRWMLDPACLLIEDGEYLLPRSKAVARIIYWMKQRLSGVAVEQAKVDPVLAVPSNISLLVDTQLPLFARSEVCMMVEDELELFFHICVLAIAYFTKKNHMSRTRLILRCHSMFVRVLTERQQALDVVKEKETSKDASDSVDIALVAKSDAAALRKDGLSFLRRLLGLAALPTAAELKATLAPLISAGLMANPSKGIVRPLPILSRCVVASGRLIPKHGASPASATALRVYMATIERMRASDSTSTGDAAPTGTDAAAADGPGQMAELVSQAPAPKEGNSDTTSTKHVEAGSGRLYSSVTEPPRTSTRLRRAGHDVSYVVDASDIDAACAGKPIASAQAASAPPPAPLIPADTLSLSTIKPGRIWNAWNSLHIALNIPAPDATDDGRPVPKSIGCGDINLRRSLTASSGSEIDPLRRLQDGRWEMRESRLMGLQNVPLFQSPFISDHTRGRLVPVRSAALKTVDDGHVGRSASNSAMVNANDHIAALSKDLLAGANDALITRLDSSLAATGLDSNAAAALTKVITDSCACLGTRPPSSWWPDNSGSEMDASSAYVSKTTPAGRCLRPECPNASALRSKYCSAQCGLIVAQGRLLAATTTALRKAPQGSTNMADCIRAAAQVGPTHNTDLAPEDQATANTQTISNFDVTAALHGLAETIKSTHILCTLLAALLLSTSSTNVVIPPFPTKDETVEASATKENDSATMTSGIPTQVLYLGQEPEVECGANTVQTSGILAPTTVPLSLHTNMRPLEAESPASLATDNRGESSESPNQIIEMADGNESDASAPSFASVLESESETADWGKKETAKSPIDDLFGKSETDLHLNVEVSPERSASLPSLDHIGAVPLSPNLALDQNSVMMPGDHNAPLLPDLAVGPTESDQKPELDPDPADSCKQTGKSQDVAVTLSKTDNEHSSDDTAVLEHIEGNDGGDGSVIDGDLDEIGDDDMADVEVDEDADEDDDGHMVSIEENLDTDMEEADIAGDDRELAVADADTRDISSPRVRKRKRAASRYVRKQFSSKAGGNSLSIPRFMFRAFECHMCGIYVTTDSAASHFTSCLSSLPSADAWSIFTSHAVPTLIQTLQRNADHVRAIDPTDPTWAAWTKCAQMLREASALSRMDDALSDILTPVEQPWKISPGDILRKSVREVVREEAELCGFPFALASLWSSTSATAVIGKAPEDLINETSVRGMVTDLSAFSLENSGDLPERLLSERAQGVEALAKELLDTVNLKWCRPWGALLSGRTCPHSRKNCREHFSWEFTVLSRLRSLEVRCIETLESIVKNAIPSFAAESGWKNLRGLMSDPLPGFADSTRRSGLPVASERGPGQTSFLGKRPFPFGTNDADARQGIRSTVQNMSASVSFPHAASRILTTATPYRNGVWNLQGGQAHRVATAPPVAALNGLPAATAARFSEQTQLVQEAYRQPSMWQLHQHHGMQQVHANAAVVRAESNSGTTTTYASYIAHLMQQQQGRQHQQ
jgi:hypothetical protein